MTARQVIAACRQTVEEESLGQIRRGYDKKHHPRLTRDFNTVPEP
jgi:hypothetical protein